MGHAGISPALTQNFEENDIRPAYLMAEKERADQADLERLLSRQNEFVSIVCPACESKEIHPLFNKKGLQYDQCLRCETFFINPRPSPKVLEDCYRNSATYEYWNKRIFPASESARREKIFRPRVDRLLGFCDSMSVDTHSLIEVGSGFGTFCEELKSRNRFQRVVGIEPTPYLAQTCRQRGIQTLELPVEKIDLEETGLFDAVVSFEVIEHLFDPKRFIRDCAKLLKPGAFLCLTCPNGKGFDISFLKSRSQSVFHGHLTYFNPGSLGGLLRSCGFEILEIQTPGRLDAELVRKAVLAGEVSVSDRPFLKKILIDEWPQSGRIFQDFLVENKMSSHLWVFARKKK